MRIAAGVLEIISGILNFIVLISLIVAGIVARGIHYAWWGIPNGPGIEITMAVLIPLTLVSAIVCIFTMAGGISALQRKKWGLSLTGAILSIFPSLLLGVLAVIFISLTKDEFE